MLSKIHNIIFKKTYLKFLDQLNIVNDSGNILSLFLINDHEFYIMNVYNNLGVVIKKDKTNRIISVENINFSKETHLSSELMYLILESKNKGTILTPFNYVEYNSNIISKLKNTKEISTKEGLFILKSISPPQVFFRINSMPKIESEQYIWVD